MRRALCVEEILLAVFDHCYDRFCKPKGKKNLTALARTCKTFKEPALDVLWVELEDLAPLVRCLPEASFLENSEYQDKYSLKRPLMRADWDIILGYTRRVCTCFLYESCGLAADCFEKLSKPPMVATSIFPKLSELTLCRSYPETVLLLRHFACPRLTILKVLYTLDAEDVITTFGEMCPNITTFEYACKEGQANPERLSGLICQWTKPHSVQCDGFSLNNEALIHLSRTPNLYHLKLDLHDTGIDHIQPISFGSSVQTFPALNYYHLISRSLVTISKLFDHFLFPMIKTLDVHLRTQPTELELRSFLTILPHGCSHEFLSSIRIAPSDSFTPPYCLNVHHLRPLMFFVNIQIIYLTNSVNVDLNEQELLQLASSWPRLLVFSLGRRKGCAGSGAITPGGFVQLLERCRSLYQFHFKFHTNGYTEVPRDHPWRGLSMREGGVINVRNSVIEEESIEALGVFFHVAPFPKFDLKFWGYRKSEGGQSLEGPPNVYCDRWMRVYSRARRLSEERRWL